MFSESLNFFSSRQTIQSISHYLKVNSTAILLGLETKFYLINLEFFFIAFTMSISLVYLFSRTHL